MNFITLEIMQRALDQHMGEQYRAMMAALRAHLALNGWVPVQWSKPLPYWGMSKSGVGSMNEDAWNKDHGPSVAPLKVATLFVHHEYAGQQGMGVKEIAWNEVPDYSVVRFYTEARGLGWIE
jgi:hypothetical protein